MHGKSIETKVNGEKWELTYKHDNLLKSTQLKLVDDKWVEINFVDPQFKRKTGQRRNTSNRLI